MTAGALLPAFARPARAQDLPTLRVAYLPFSYAAQVLYAQDVGFFKKAGINVGDQLEVVRVTREIKDPSTGQVIRRMTTTVGVIKAADVDDGSAVCDVVSGSGFKVGDAVHTVTQ